MTACNSQQDGSRGNLGRNYEVLDETAYAAAPPSGQLLLSCYASPSALYVNPNQSYNVSIVVAGGISNSYRLYQTGATFTTSYTFESSVPNPNPIGYLVTRLFYVVDTNNNYGICRYSVSVNACSTSNSNSCNNRICPGGVCNNNSDLSACSISVTPSNPIVGKTAQVRINATGSNLVGPLSVSWQVPNSFKVVSALANSSDPLNYNQMSYIGRFVAGGAQTISATVTDTVSDNRPSVTCSASVTPSVSNFVAASQELDPTANASARVIPIYRNAVLEQNLTPFSETTGYTGSLKIAAGDFDRSGTSRLAVYAPGLNKVRVFLSSIAEFTPFSNYAPNTFTAPYNTSTTYPFATNSKVQIAAGDINGDSQSDIILMVGSKVPGNAFTPDTVAFPLVEVWTKNASDNNFTRIKVFKPFNTNGYQYFACGGLMAAGDWNSDGNDDLMISRCNAGNYSQIIRYQGRAIMLYGTPQLNSQGQVTGIGTPPLADTSSIAVVRDSNNNEISIAYNSTYEPMAVASADLNNDGFYDMAFGSFYSFFTFHYLTQLTSDGFTELKKFDVTKGLGSASTTGRPQRIAFSDINSDGYQDLVTTGVNANVSNCTWVYGSYGTGFSDTTPAAYNFRPFTSNCTASVLLTGF